jgi:hypothetical protein
MLNLVVSRECQLSGWARISAMTIDTEAMTLSAPRLRAIEPFGHVASDSTWR